MQVNSSPSQLWIGLRTTTELPSDLDAESCLSPNIVNKVQRDYTPGVVPTPWLIDPNLIDSIQSFLKRHPLFSIMHQACIDHAIELMTTWYAFENGNITTTVTVNENSTKEEWEAYLSTMTPRRYKLSFQIEHKNGQRCYNILGPRDTMMALFGWNATISDKNLTPPICLRSKLSLGCDEFIRMFEVTKKAEYFSQPTQL